MLFLLSPAKTLDCDSPMPSALREAATRPLSVTRAEAIDKLREWATARTVSADRGR